MSSIKNYLLRCPVSTMMTFPIPVSLAREDTLYTSDPRAIHMLRMSMFVQIHLDQTEDYTRIPCTEVFPSFESDGEGMVEVPNFGYLDQHIVWISPQAVSDNGKGQILKDLPRSLSMHYLDEAIREFEK